MGHLVKLSLAFAIGAFPAFSGALETSPRPMLRSENGVFQTASYVTPSTSLRPVLRHPLMTETTPIDIRADGSDAGLQNWIRGFRGRALAAGISAKTFEAAFTGVRYNDEVIKRDRNQSEFTKTIWEYLDSAASDTRISNGKSALRQYARTLQAIEDRYGVDKEVVAAVWGLESAYGTHRGKMPIIESLATLAYDGRRGSFFEQQLIAALKILQNGDTTPQNMTGSWAGAMGHTQFIPTSYLAFAQDFTGDGRRDIWADDPSDALASTASYLAKHGWVKGMPWGVEVRVPQNFNFTLANRKIKKMPSEWASLGVVGVNGKAVPDYGTSSLLLPAGAQGAAFLIFKNFSVIERYNAADAYVIGVGHLSDRLRGRPAIQSGWPRGDRALNFAERKEMQQRLTSAGFDTQGVDGKIGPNTIDAVRAYQRHIGMAQDGYPSLMVLEKLRR